MVEVDPLVLVAAGSLIVGLAIATIFMRPSSKPHAHKSAQKKETHVVADSGAKAKKKKKAKKSGAGGDTSGEEEHSPKQQTHPQKVYESSVQAHSNAVAAAAASKETSEKVASEKAAAAKSAADKAAIELAEKNAKKLIAEEEAKKKKKKETPEQRAARKERQSAAKANQAAAAATASKSEPDDDDDDDDEENVKPPAKVVQETKQPQNHKTVPAHLVDTVQLGITASGAHHDADEWAVVDKKKSKAIKKGAEPEPVPVQAPAASAPAAAAAAPAAPEEPVDFVKSEVAVDGKKLGVVIGPKGATLRAIQETTGVEINTPKGDRDNSVPVMVSVAGTADGVARATRIIKDLTTKGYSKAIAGPDFQEGGISVHPM
jgi:KH domain